MSEIQNYIIEHPTAVVVTLTLLSIFLLLAIGNGFKHSGIALELRDRLEQARVSQSEIDRVHDEQLQREQAAAIAYRREFTGYKQAVRDLTAHPTTVIVSDKQQSRMSAHEFDEFHNGNFAHDVRAAARNGEPI